MEARVREIQVGGMEMVHSLEEACRAYLNPEILRTKIYFLIEMPDGSLASITIRDEEDKTIAYGSLEGLPSVMDYAQEVFGKKI